KNAGMIIAGVNPVVTDIVTATLMGFDWQKIPLLREALRVEKWPVAEVSSVKCQGEEKIEPDFAVVINGREMAFDQLASSELRMDFEPAEGWKGHIELDR
ncbi:MAG: hypothetical protein JXQ75_01150, partial [Phycisphaerae bacterium]|nr:hypothetical protein [Phycisphaerae bacterium]